MAMLSNTFLIWSPDSPRRVWGLDYNILYSYLGICHVFVMRSLRSLTIILPGHTAVSALVPLLAALESATSVMRSSGHTAAVSARAYAAPAPFPFSDSNFGALSGSDKERGVKIVGCVTA